jgi:hypothetical protein
MFSDSNQHIFVHEDDMWAVKGRFETALEDDDDVVWTFANGQDILGVLIICNLFFSIFHFNLSKL